MFKVSDIATKKLINLNIYKFGILSLLSKRPKIKPDLTKYDLVIAGGHLGGILSTHYDAVVGKKASIFVAYDNPYYQLNVLRNFYQQGSFTKFAVTKSTKTTITKYAATSEGQGIAKYKPQNNQIVLRNGRTIQYDQLVIATGMDNNHQSIKGFQQAWADVSNLFHTNQDHSSWKSFCSKPFKYQFNFTGGQAIFYIPPAPFYGELENYNFLLSKPIWDRLAFDGRITWDNSSFTIINSNNSFCPYFDKGNTFFKSQLQKNNIKIEQGLKLIQIKKKSQTAVFQNMITGEFSERIYHKFYSLMPSKPQSNLTEAGLADKSGFLDVDPYTLQHKKYKNIFGLGDVTNVPTSKTFYAGFNQLHVVRNNLERQMNGLSLNAKYDGTSSALVHVGIQKLALLKHDYNGVGPAINSGFSANVRFKMFNSFGKKQVQNILAFKDWGPPYYKFKKTFPKEKEIISKTEQSLYPQKKSVD